MAARHGVVALCALLGLLLIAALIPTDPSRAAELLSRNSCGTPFFMPATFEALAPKRST